MLYFMMLLFHLVNFDQATSRLNPLSSYQWKNRILIISGDSYEMQSCYQLYKKEKEKIKDRDMKLIYISPSMIQTFPYTPDIEAIKANIISHFAIHPDKGETILIGKDGGVKLRKPIPVSTSEVFDLIDSMPMRQAEMRKK